MSQELGGGDRVHRGESLGRLFGVEYGLVDLDGDGHLDIAAAAPGSELTQLIPVGVLWPHWRALPEFPKG